MQFLVVWNFFLQALLLRPLDGVSWGATLVVWVVRILTLSLLFRTYIGPTIVRLVSRRLRIRSVSLRSIRGIYFKAGSGTWRVERVGISYHRPTSGQASRFSVQVQGLSLELDGQATEVSRKASSGSKTRKVSRTDPSRFVRRASWALLSSIYTTLEPYCRPVVRTFFVNLLRLGISALPAITHVVDFELDSAVLTCAALPGVRLSVEEAKLHTSVSLASLPNVVTIENGRAHPTIGHRRFASVADWNARLKGSVRRTWDRAWGATQVTASVILHVKGVNGHIDRNNDSFAGTVFPWHGELYSLHSREPQGSQFRQSARYTAFCCRCSQSPSRRGAPQRRNISRFRHGGHTAGCHPESACKGQTTPFREDGRERLWFSCEWVACVSNSKEPCLEVIIVPRFAIHGSFIGM